MVLGNKVREVRVSVEVCILSIEESARLENFGIWPSCRNHRHAKKAAAQEMVNTDEFRFVGGPNTKVKYCTAIVATRESAGWVPVACHDWDGHLLIGMRVWGNRPQL